MNQQELVIKPEVKWKLFDLKELWRYRELFYIFTWRDIKVRYKQTFLGVLWVVFQPLATMLIFSNFFGKLANIPSDNLPYELFVLTGIVYWNFFSSALSRSSNSLVSNAGLLRKVYFPREVLPVSATLSNLIDFFVNFIILLIVFFLAGYFPSPLFIIIFPLTLLITLTSATGLGFFLSSINIKYRDIGYMLPFFIQLLMFLTPVIYPASLIRNSLRFVYSLNPLTGSIESMRKVLQGVNDPNWGSLGLSFLSSIFLLLVGIYFFKLTERYFSDLA